MAMSNEQSQTQGEQSMVDNSLIVRARTPRKENQSDRGGALEGVIG